MNFFSLDKTFKFKITKFPHWALYLVLFEVQNIDIVYESIGLFFFFKQERIKCFVSYQGQ